MVQTQDEPRVDNRNQEKRILDHATIFQFFAWDLKYARHTGVDGEMVTLHVSDTKHGQRKLKITGAVPLPTVDVLHVCFFSVLTACPPFAITLYQQPRLMQHLRIC